MKPFDPIVRTTRTRDFRQFILWSRKLRHWCSRFLASASHALKARGAAKHDHFCSYASPYAGAGGCGASRELSLGSGRVPGSTQTFGVHSNS
jgi:hypothetical protein